MHSGINWSQRRATFHVASVLSFINIMDFIDDKNAVEQIGFIIPLYNAPSNFASFACLDRREREREEFAQKKCY